MNFLEKIPILKEFEWFELFEWSGPSPIEPFNSVRDEAPAEAHERPRVVHRRLRARLVAVLRGGVGQLEVLAAGVAPLELHQDTLEVGRRRHGETRVPTRRT